MNSLLCAILFMGTALGAAGPQIKRQDAPATSTAQQTVLSVTGCHMHGATQFCMVGTTEYRVAAATATATQGLPSSYTGCHKHGSDTYCFGPSNSEVQIVGANQAAPTTTASGSAAAAPQITAISGCHVHSSSSLYCMNGDKEFYVKTKITGTATSDIPAQFTGCHSHGAELYCFGKGGEDIPVLPAEDVKSGKANPEERHCHFHAGVEHCVGGTDEGSCERVDRDYKIPIRIGMLFVVLVASAVGVFGPILLSRFVPIKANIFLTVLKQFGTGIIISTAFIHLYTHATLMFGNKCLGRLNYEGTTSAIVMAGLFISFLIEVVVHRAMRWQAAKKTESDIPFMSSKAVASAEIANISIMEAGIIFHSILIGITLVVAGDAYFITLTIVIVFHQLFEGIALGTRIASIGYGNSTAALTMQGHLQCHGAPISPVADRVGPSSVPMWKKLFMGACYTVVTPIGMAIGIGVLKSFNGNDPSTIIAIGTLDALSAGILIWVGLVEMWAQDWLLGGELSDAGLFTTCISMFGLIAGMALMSILGKWA